MVGTGRLLPVVLALLATHGCASPPCEVLLVRSEDSSASNWGALPGFMSRTARVEMREDGRLPEGDLHRYRLIALSTNLNVYHKDLRRLWEFANRGGILVTWFADDARSEPAFWPYRLVLGDRDPDQVTFRNDPHPLLEGLRGKAFSGQMRGGDVVRDWDREHWQVLADSPDGPALLVAPYGAGHIVAAQFHTPFSAREELARPLADNLLKWAGVKQVAPEDLAARSDLEVLTALARRQLRELGAGEWKRGSWEDVEKSRPVRGISWSYPRGVTLYGLLKLSESGGGEEWRQFVLRHNELVAKQWDWLTWQIETFGRRTPAQGIEELMRLSSLDDCGSMGSQVVEGLLAHGASASPEMTRMLERIADYIHTRQSRLPDGTLCRGRTLWIDDLYMSVPFLARWGTYSGKPEYWDDAAKQIINFASRLQAEDGLWYHGWFDREQRHSRHKWGRGNGWAVLAQVELLGQLPKDHPERPKLLGILDRHVQGIAKHQAESGMWRQIVDMEDLWEETSCTGMFAYALARSSREGWVDLDGGAAARKAFDALKTRVLWDGSLMDTCVGTGVNNSLDYYRERPRMLNDPHGPGPVLLAGAELLREQ